MSIEPLSMRVQVRGRFSFLVAFAVLCLLWPCNVSQAENAPPDNLERAKALAEHGDFKAAEKLYLQLLQVNPKSYEVHNDLGVLYLTEQRYDVACHQFLLATNFNPKASVGYQNLGICQIKAGDIAKAAESLRKARDLEPDDLQDALSSWRMLPIDGKDR